MASPAEFRRLKGVGPAAEARLHDAGVGTWADLAQVLTVLAKAAPRHDGLPGLLRAVSAQSDPAEPEPETEPEAEVGPDPEPAAGPTDSAAAEPRPLLIDAGLAIGGAVRDVTVPLGPAPGCAPGQAYRAELVGRQLGAGGAGGWRPLGARQLRPGADGSAPGTVRFEATPVPDGIHRLLVRLTPSP